MSLLSQVSSHLRGRIGEIRRRLSSPFIPLYSSFVWSHLPERTCDKFNDYLWGAPKFLVRTDNNPLTYALTSAKLDATGHRWLAALASFDFEIEYTPGVSNQDADALSRIDIASVQAMCSVDFAPFAATMVIFADNLEEEASPFPHIPLSEIRKAQNEDEVLGVWMTAKRKKKCPVLKHTSNPAKHGIMKKSWHRFFFKEDCCTVRLKAESLSLSYLLSMSQKCVEHYIMT